MARSRGTDGEVWCGERLSQCCYASFGSPAFGNELTWKILRGHGAIVWSLVRSVHFYCYWGTWSSGCWPLTTVLIAFIIFLMIFSPYVPSLLGVSQQFAGVYSALFQSWPPSSPGQAGGPVYLLGLVMLQARLPAEKRERIITLPSPSLVTSTSSCKIALFSPPPPLRLERPPSHD